MRIREQYYKKKLRVRTREEQKKLVDGLRRVSKGSRHTMVVGGSDGVSVVFTRQEFLPKITSIKWPLMRILEAILRILGRHGSAYSSQGPLRCYSTAIVHYRQTCKGSREKVMQDYTKSTSDNDTVHTSKLNIHIQIHKRCKDKKRGSGSSKLS